MSGHFLLVGCTVLAAAATGAVSAFFLWHRFRFPKSKGRVIAFFHPFCASGGGGERVLWAIIQALGEIDKDGLPIKVLIYTIDPCTAQYRKGKIL
jgi:ALG11 mannosyltransferase N-terminus